MLISDRAKYLGKVSWSKMMNKLSSFLYARPSFAEGVARLIDFGNTLQEYNSSLIDQQADFLAIAADWRVVGDDLRSAMSEFDEFDSRADELVIEAQKELTGV